MDNIKENFNSETKAITFLFKALFFCLHLAIMTEFFNTPKFRIGLKFVFFIWFAIPYLKTIKNRYYTYWTFSILLLMFLLYSFVADYQNGHEHIAFLYGMSCVILVLKMSFLYSPLYYPRVSWWEYDFRYKDDLKISIQCEGNEYKARLTDLRRQAGCVAAFEELKIGEEIVVNTEASNEKILLRAVVMTRRKDVIGRPIIYGVQFKFDNKRNKTRYKQLVKMWKSEKHNKKKMKFANV